MIWHKYNIKTRYRYAIVSENNKYLNVQMQESKIDDYAKYENNIKLNNHNKSKKPIVYNQILFISQYLGYLDWNVRAWNYL